MRLLPLLLFASACAAANDGPSSGETDLTRELAGRTAGPPQDCVSASSGATLVPRGRQALVYERGDTIWVNRLRAECPGLDEMSQLIIEVNGGRHCRGDRFRTRRSGESVPGPICVLGSFTPYRR
ncbi:MAG TPA: hypothetical protein VGA98_02775 [Allosphingosinicella sp.]|jgi:hypothetical protein